MSRFRTLPLLLAVTSCLAVAGCGSSDKPTTTSASAPTTATQTAPTTATTPATTAATTPTTTDAKPTTTTPAPNNPLAKLKDYTKGGQPASEAEATAVRNAMRDFGDAIAKHDVKAICARTLGLDALMQKGTKGDQKTGGCERLFKNSANASAAPSKKDMEAVANGKVTIKGDRASLTISDGTPLPMRKVGGVWKVDYGAFTGLGAKK